MRWGRAAAAVALVAASLVAAPAPAAADALTAGATRVEQASTYGWRWSGTVRVFDGTPAGSVWDVAGAVGEWSARSGFDATLTTDEASADVRVYEVQWFSVDVPSNVMGLAWTPSTSGGVATGSCRVELARWVTGTPVTAQHTAEHELGHCFGLAHNSTDRSTVMAPSVRLGDGLARPTAADYRSMKSLYGR